MKLTKIKIRNFRSFDDTGIEIESKNGLNIIVGENNVGKSNILNALEFLKNRFLGRSHTLNKKDWHNEDIAKELEIHVEFELSDIDFEEIITYFAEGNSERRQIYSKDFQKSGHISLKTNFKEKDNNRVIYNINIINNSGNRINFIFKEKKYHDFFAEMFDERLKIFPDIRRRPKKSNRIVSESLNGIEIVNSLSYLKNGKENEQEKYKSIQSNFLKMFNLMFEIRNIKEKDHSPDIFIKKGKFETTIKYAGMGIVEMITFLTNIIASKGKIICVEEPELHLPPHAQRLLFEIIKEYQKDNQFFIITHSPFFIDSENIESHFFAKQTDGYISIRQLPKKDNSKPYFTEKEKSKIYKNLNADSKELFFSRKILLVEGETEIGAMPVFAKKLNKDLDTNGISILWSGSKDNFEIFIKLLLGFEIPYIVMCDRDAIMGINRGKIDDCKISSLFFQLNNLELLDKNDVHFLKELEKDIVTVENKKGKRIQQYKDGLFENLKKISEKHKCYSLSDDFEGILKEKGYEALFKEAKEEVGKSKARQGRYIAEKIVSANKEIPEEFIEIINKIYELK